MNMSSFFFKVYMQVIMKLLFYFVIRQTSWYK